MCKHTQEIASDMPPSKKEIKTQKSKHDTEKIIDSILAGLTHSDDAKKRSALHLLQGQEDTEDVSVEAAE